MRCSLSHASHALYAGIDLGTSRVKVGIFDHEGRQIRMEVIAHSPLLFTAEVATQDPTGWWAAVRDGLRRAVAGLEPAYIAALAVCGQGPTLVGADAALQPLGRALTWMDQRAHEEAGELSALLGRQVDASRLIAKALRLTRREPDSRRRWFLQSWDFLAALLCGVPHTSAAWDAAEIAVSGLPADHFPPYVVPGRPVGVVTASAARETGLAAGTLVVAGTNDSIASCIGSGLVEQGQGAILGGTSGGFVLAWGPVPGLWTPPPDTYPEPPGLHYLGATISSSGLALDWVASLCSAGDYDAWLARAADIPPGADGLVLLPYIAGVYLPYSADGRAALDDPSARGVLFGLGLRHDTTHLARAAMEGVGFAVRQLYEATVAQAGPPSAIWSVGGQARSLLWNQIKADILGRPILIPAVVEAGALGAAALAATGEGRFEDVWQAARAMTHQADQLEPDSTAHERYSQLYEEVYSRLYPRLADLFPLLPLRL